MQQWEVDMDVEPLGLERSETVGQLNEFFLHGQQVIESLLQFKVGEIVGAEFVSQEGRELFVLFD
jgi:hypothetical protein